MAEEARWRTSITDVRGDDLYYRGYHFLELAEKMDFASVVYLLFKGELPTPQQAKVFNALMISVCDHGIVFNSAVSRIVAACGSPIQASIAAGILTVGDIAGGAGEAATRMYKEVLERGQREGKSSQEMAVTYVTEQLAEKKRINGYGHPMHPKGDPRASWLLGVSDKYGVSGDYVALARAMEEAIRKISGRAIPMNVDGASAAVLCELGLDWRFAKAILIIPRAAGLAAHSVEETVREKGWRIVAAPEEIAYDGPPPRKVPSV